jgi:hypothetical protein
VPPWVSISIVSSLSPSTFLVLGERARVRGQSRAHSCKSSFDLRNIWRPTERETRQSATNRPPLLGSPPESHNGVRFGGRGENWSRLLTQGGAKGSCPRLPWAIFLTPLQGSQEEAVASCRCTS